MKSFKVTLYVLAIFAVVGCSTPTRVDIEKFPSKLSGRIDKKEIPKFSDCIFDGFNPLQGTAFAARQVRQQSGSISRIETLVAAGSILFTSVDIHEDGRVELFITTALPPEYSQPESDVFVACLKKYEKP